MESEIGMSAIRGSCLCGGVKLEITGPLSSPLNCHCSLCRKQHAAPFRSRARVQVDDFRWIRGEHLVKYYETLGGYQRGFCGECGSPRSSTAQGQTRNVLHSLRNPYRNTEFHWPFLMIRR
jgi:hypothetical protein